MADKDYQKIVMRVPSMNITGKVDMSNIQDKRTITYLNRTPRIVGLNTDPILEGYISIYDFRAYYKGKEILRAPKKKVRKDYIIFAYDEFKRLGNDKAAEMTLNRVEPKTVGILTKSIGTTIFYITGTVISLEKMYSDPLNQFIPLTNPVVENIVSKMKGSRNYSLKIPFMALNRDYIQAYEYQ